MGQFGSGLAQGLAQGIQQGQARAFQKQQLDLEKKRFDLEDKQSQLQMQILRQKLQEPGFLDSIFGGLAGGGQNTGISPPPPMPSAPKLDQSPLTLRGSLTGQGPQLNVPDLQVNQDIAPAPPQTAPQPTKLRQQMLGPSLQTNAPPAPTQAPVQAQEQGPAQTAWQKYAPADQAKIGMAIHALVVQGNLQGAIAMAQQYGLLPQPPPKLGETVDEQLFADYLKDHPNDYRGAADFIAEYKAKQKPKPEKPPEPKTPLPTTDQGWTISQVGGVNYASKASPNGQVIREPYDPNKHGIAMAASEGPIQRELEKGILTDKEALAYGKGIAEGRIAPAQIAEVSGGFGQVSNINRGKIAKVMAKEFPKFGWKNADILFKYQSNPTVFMGIVNVNAVRPRVEAMRQKFATLKNLDFLPANAAKNAIAKTFGDPAVVDFESNRTQVVFELQRALTGIGMMSDSRIQQELNNLATSYSPGQMNKAIDNIDEILDVRLSALQAGPFAQPQMPAPMSFDDYYNKISGGK